MTPAAHLLTQAQTTGYALLEGATLATLTDMLSVAEFEAELEEFNAGLDDFERAFMAADRKKVHMVRLHR